MTWLDPFAFIALPYVAVIVFFVGTIRRYLKQGFGISSLSVQFLEGRIGFWGTVPFHIGILALLELTSRQESQQQHRGCNDKR